MSTAIPIDGAGIGYIRLYRKIIENALFKNKPAAWFKIWIYILIRANWRGSVFRPRQGESITVPAGSLVTSLEKLGTHAGLTKEHARRCLEYLERTQTVTLRRTHHWTMITVVNWTTYQQHEDEPQHPEHHAEHHDGVENGTRETPHSPPHAATPSKEVKNSDKKYKSNPSGLDPLGVNCESMGKPRADVDPEVREGFEAEFWPLYPRHEGKQPALKAASAKATTAERREYYLKRLKAQLPEYNQRKQESGQRVIPMGSTWFNQERADDELALSPEPSRQASRAATQGDYEEHVPFTARAV